MSSSSTCETGPMRGHDLINTLLPDECLVEIFKHLDGQAKDRNACSLVCKRWKRIDSATRDTIQIRASDCPDSCISVLVRRFTDLRNIFFDERLPLHPTFQNFLRGFRQAKNSSRSARCPKQVQAGSNTEDTESSEYGLHNLSDKGLSLLGEGCPKLERISLVWCSAVTNHGFAALAQHCQNLKILDLQGCFVGDQGLQAVGALCKNLEDVTLRFCAGITDVGVVFLATCLGQSLKAFGIAACARVTDIALEAIGVNCSYLERLALDSESFKDAGVHAIAKGCALLRFLQLQCVNVTAEALQAVESCCPYLETLALFSFQKFCNGSFSTIGNGSKNIKILILNDCNFISDSSLVAVASGCSDLTQLEVNCCHNVSSAGVGAIGRSCGKLEELVLKYSQKIGNEALLEIGRGCLHLQTLVLVDCTAIGDESICNIAEGCQNLRKLHVRRCYQVGDQGLAEIGKKCKMLTDLSLRFCDRIGSKSLIAIGQGCKMLKYLNISGCHRVGDDGINAVAKGCPLLLHLDISVCKNVGDSGITAISAGCLHLREIILSHCRNVTDVALSFLVKNCLKLELCHMVFCPSITSWGVATVISGCTNIQKVLVENSKITARTRRRGSAVLTELCMEL
ncbi:hypothetical protein O6H91_14G042700 [Diphasiastrum complanatum]|uniref:Uncharacterized protein n=1 Tax=Diphasiastrum complanatum TaxID=34168 RepID=A0ACC2BP29_DIPCM|nr:hypothetical protein O6H91_14G042700 [Diphasiastrum complanatum]